MAIARGRLILQETTHVGNVLLKPTIPHATALPMKNKILLRQPQQPGGMGRTLTTFCNRSIIGVKAPATRLFVPSAIKTPPFHERSLSTSESPSVLIPKEVDLSKINFGTPVRNAKGGLFIPDQYGTKKSLRIQTPVMRIPFGLSSSTLYESSGMTVNVSFDQYESNPQLKQFFEFIKKFDNRVFESGKSSHKDWFPGKKYIPEVLEANFKRNIKDPKDPKYSPLMKFKVPQIKDKYEIDVFIENEPTTMEALTPNAMIIAIVEPRSVWIVNGNFGVTWTVRQIKIVESGPIGEGIKESGGYAFRDSEINYTKRTPEEIARLSNPNPPPPVDVEEEEVVAEAEELVEEEEEETPAPPPKRAPARSASPTKTAQPVSRSSSPPPLKSKTTPIPIKTPLKKK